MWDTVSFAANKLSALSGQCVFLSVTMAVANEAFSSSSRLSELSESEKVLYVSWSINWSWFCLSLPRGKAVLMKLLNEAEGAIFVQIFDHACRWHRQSRWHLGANYTDFTPARV